MATRHKIESPTQRLHLVGRQSPDGIQFAVVVKKAVFAAREGNWSEVARLLQTLRTTPLAQSMPVPGLPVEQAYWMLRCLLGERSRR
jgi:hypothetical protein